MTAASAALPRSLRGVSTRGTELDGHLCWSWEFSLNCEKFSFLPQIGKNIIINSLKHVDKIKLLLAFRYKKF